MPVVRAAQPQHVRAVGRRRDLPYLGLVTGYLGTNAGGNPGVNWGQAIAVVGVGLVLVAALQLWLFRRLKWV